MVELPLVVLILTHVVALCVGAVAATTYIRGGLGR